MPNATLKHRGRVREDDANGATVLTATIQYDVIEATDQRDALTAVPPKGSAHPVYGNALRLSARDADHVSGDYYIVTTDYSSRAPLGDTDDPLNRTPDVEWNLNVSTEEVDRDWTGHPITNSAGDAPQTQPIADIWEPTMEWVQWETGYNIVKAIAFSGAVNEDDIAIDGFVVRAGECRCTGIVPAGAFKSGTTPLPIRYSFGFRQRYAAQAQGTTGQTFVSAFDFRFRDQGVEGWYLKSNVQTKGRFHNTATEPVDEDVPLDGTGQPLNTEVKVSEGMVAALSKSPPAGAIIDLTWKFSDPPAVFLFYQKCRRQKFKGLIPGFK